MDTFELSRKAQRNMTFFISDYGSYLSTLWNARFLSDCYHLKRAQLLRIRLVTGREHLFYKATAETGSEFSAAVKSSIHCCCLFEDGIQHKCCGEESWLTVWPSVAPTRRKPTVSAYYS